MLHLDFVHYQTQLRCYLVHVVVQVVVQNLSSSVRIVLQNILFDEVVDCYLLACAVPFFEMYRHRISLSKKV